MNIYISYFYQIRFFPPTNIPVSTAKYDPKWYYNGKQGKTYKDARGVYNGIRADILVFPESMWNTLTFYENECSKDCPHNIDNEPCDFMKLYRKYLDTLSFDNIYKRCLALSKRIQNLEHFDVEPDVTFMVHEPKTCNCAERPVLQDWFKSYGYELKEWEKEEEQISWRL